MRLAESAHRTADASGAMSFSMDGGDDYSPEYENSSSIDWLEGGGDEVESDSEGSDIESDSGESGSEDDGDGCSLAIDLDGSDVEDEESEESGRESGAARRARGEEGTEADVQAGRARDGEETRRRGRARRSLGPTSRVRRTRVSRFTNTKVRKHEKEHNLSEQRLS